MSENKAQYYIFSDESGNQKLGKYFLRACFLIKAEDYFTFSKKISELKENYNIPLNEEFKYNCLQNIILYEKKERDKCSKFCDPYKDLGSEWLKEFIEKSLELLSEYNVSIIIVYGLINNQSDLEIVELCCMKALLSRIEPYLVDLDGQGVIFYDDFDKNKKNELYEAYSKIFNESKFVIEYKCIKDSLTFDSSKYSSGIQVVDYIAGCSDSFLNSYTWGTTQFKKYIYQKLRYLPPFNITQTGFINLFSKKYPTSTIFIEEPFDTKPPKTFEEFEVIK